MIEGQVLQSHIIKMVRVKDLGAASSEAVDLSLLSGVDCDHPSRRSERINGKHLEGRLN